MPLFRYEAVDRTGKIVMGAMSASSESEVGLKLNQMGYRPQAVQPAQAQTAPPNLNQTGAQSTRTIAQPSGALSNRKYPGPKALALFFRQFASLVRSGISIYDALDDLSKRTDEPTLREASAEMASAARTGGQISNVMARYPRVFPEHVIAGIQAGELGGYLDIVLDEMAYDYEQEIAFYKGMWLPKTLLVQQLLAVAVAQPLFPTLFPNNNLKGFLIAVFARNLPIALGIILGTRFAYRCLQEPKHRLRRDSIALNTPVFGDLARQKALFTFVRTLSRLYKAGIGPIGAWEGAMSVAPNVVIRNKLVAASRMMQGNVPLHEAFRSTGLFANETEQLLATGVVAGQTVEMLDRVAEYYHGNVERALSSSKFWMYRLSISLFIALMGVVAIMMVKTYFTSVFAFADSFNPE